MHGAPPGFLPDRLRPQTSRRRSRRGLALLSVVPVMLLSLPQWRVEEVRIDGCSRLPESEVRSLQELVGEPALDLDLTAIRSRIQGWPGIGDVQVALELPGTIVVSAVDEIAVASIRVGRSWHGIGNRGELIGVVGVPLRPVLEGFDAAVDRRRALAALRRIEAASPAEVMSVERVAPADYRVSLLRRGDDRGMVIHVRPGGTVAEMAWCAAIARGEAPQRWADLRWDDRMVVGSGG